MPFPSRGKGRKAGQELGPPQESRVGRERTARLRCEGARGNRPAHHGQTLPHPPACRTRGRWDRHPGIGYNDIYHEKTSRGRGAGDHCLPKLRHQPCILACLVTIQSALSPFSFQSVQHTSAHRPPPCSEECPCVRSVSASRMRLGQDRHESVRAMLRQDKRTVQLLMMETREPNHYSR